MRRHLSSLAAVIVCLGLCPAPRAEAALSSESLRSFVKRIGARIESAKGDLLVTSREAGRGRVEIRLLNDTTGHRLGFYAYGFGNVAGAKDPKALYEYLLRANSDLAIGSFFVDKDQDIGYKFILNTREPPSYITFETVYLAMAKIIQERGPVIIRMAGGAGAPPKTPAEALEEVPREATEAPGESPSEPDAGPPTTPGAAPPEPEEAAPENGSRPRRAGRP